jgi:DinB superfamily
MLSLLIPPAFLLPRSSFLLPAFMDFDVDHGLAVLERTPDVLRALLAGLPEVWTHQNEGPATWSPREVVGHLIEGERSDWIPRERIVLAQGPSAAFAPFDRTAHQRSMSASASLTELVETFARMRAENLATLRGWHLTPAQLELTGVHPEFGLVTMKQHLATWVAHDLGHLVQIARTMARQYREAVGPWRAYLTALH